jgi:hypothetical protein
MNSEEWECGDVCLALICVSVQISYGSGGPKSYIRTALCMCDGGYSSHGRTDRVLCLDAEVRLMWHEVDSHCVNVAMCHGE